METDRTVNESGKESQDITANGIDTSPENRYGNNITRSTEYGTTGSTANSITKRTTNSTANSIASGAGDRLLEALRHIDVAETTYMEWLSVGMALKAEGYSWQDWDNWSKNDIRYRPDACRQKWETFMGSAKPVRGGTIIYMALERGWNPTERQWSPMERQGNPTARQWNPMEQQGNPTERQWNPMEQQGNPTARQWNPMERQGNPIAMQWSPAGNRSQETLDWDSELTEDADGSPYVGDSVGSPYVGDHAVSSHVEDNVTSLHVGDDSASLHVGDADAQQSSAATDGSPYVGDSAGSPYVGDHAMSSHVEDNVTSLHVGDGKASLHVGDADEKQSSVCSLSPAEQCRLYIETMFRPKDRVSIITNDVWKNAEGKWCPGRGSACRTAEQLVAELRRYPDDPGAAIGDWKPECGAWIRINPVDGNGIKNKNIRRFSHALVESDTLPLPEQERLVRELRLPVACLVYSGGKSLHAVVRVDAENEDEYRERVDFLYRYLEAHGLPVDEQNRNPARLSRLPGVTRNGKQQTLLGVNLGASSWAAWKEWIGAEESTPPDGRFSPLTSKCNNSTAAGFAGTAYSNAGFADSMHSGNVYTGDVYSCSVSPDPTDGLPPIEPLDASWETPPELPEELICGILRRGHKMLVSGSSKAGKSFLLMELCVAIAEGTDWLGFPCKKGSVLYVNLEIDRPSCIDRFHRIYSALKLPPEHIRDISLWNLRGMAQPLDQLVPKLLERTRDRHYDAIILDPIYKILMGDENSASDMGKFCNEFDRIALEAGSAVIYCHHHSKGAQGAKKARDRASGSGVFARDPDAQLDMIQLELTEDIINNVADKNATAWRLESSLREFANIKPLNFWFEYPVHRPDTSGELDNVCPEGSPDAFRAKNRKTTTREERLNMLLAAYQACSIDMPVTVKDMAEYAGITERCLRDRLREAQDVFWISKGIVGTVDNGLNRNAGCDDEPDY